MDRDVLFEQQLPSGQILRIVHGDLTEERVDAIVNAANEQLAHGGGVAGAILRKGGPLIQKESTTWVRENGPVETGTAAITSAGDLAVKKVIHAVGPVWRGGASGEAQKLTSAVDSALALAAKHHLATVSVPAISSGIFGFPKALCAQIIIDAVRALFRDHPNSSIREVNLVSIERSTTDVFVCEAQKRTLA